MPAFRGFPSVRPSRFDNKELSSMRWNLPQPTLPLNSPIKRSTRTFVSVLVVLATAMIFAPVPSTVAQDSPPPSPIDLPCATNASSQLLGATPVGDGSQTLVLARVLFDPGGRIGEHTHPGTLVVMIESGAFGLTLVEEGEMIVTHPATADGMVHTGSNLSDGQTTVLISGLIETGTPLTLCVDTATPAS
jgi:quercetin dioxygenase-like cupin family protein